MNLFEGEEFKDPLSALQSELLRYRDAGAFIQSLTVRYNTNPWLVYINQMAQLVEPIDRDLGVDPDRSAGKAFFNGAIIGFHVISLCAPEEVRKKMIDVSIVERSDDPDPLQRRHDVSSSLIDNGEIGNANVPELAELLESLEAEITPDVRYQPFVRRGFGVMMSILGRASAEIAKEEERQNFETIEQAHRDGVDWDSELTRLLNPEDGESS
jgi:hypothetical protein